MFAFNFFEPVTNAMLGVLNAIHSVVPSYGLDMILLALVVRAALFPLAQQQFKSMAEMQKVQPLLKKLQADLKGKPQELQAATMALYKEHGVNPLAGCFPMVIQLPILLGLFYAINSQIDKFQHENFLWIGSPLSVHFPQIFATSLATLDMPLFLLYIASMYISVRYGSPPSSDPHQAQTQKLMAIVSPLMIAFFGFKYHWASALLIYWLVLNLLTMGQQFYMYRRYGLIGGKKTVAAEPVVATPVGNGKSSARPAITGGKNGSTSGRASRRSKR
ncbi:MAG TPA: YidC/Oxa1 family membrane protein insertase [Candidatus Lustribacter sp.]